MSALPLVDKRIDSAVSAVALDVLAFPEPADLIGSAIEAVRLRGWSIDAQEWWTYLRPPMEVRRIQGWKLHVSATALSAPEVLASCFPVLTQAGVMFKFATSSAVVEKLNDFRCPRGNSGKFITAYPPNLQCLHDLAERLHQATRGLAGPTVLSDAQYAADSLVHYRYGAFDGYRILTNDGLYRDCVLDPDTNPVEDLRLGVFRPPIWVALPFADRAEAQVAAGAADHQPAPVLLKGRYLVSVAVRHANKGGVYRAQDRVTGHEVIIKEARAHVATDLRGRDVRDFLRHEAMVLRRLSGLGITPAVVDEFDHDGHAFLVEEFLEGATLRARVDEALRTSAAATAMADVIDLAAGLARLVHAVHNRGVVLRDLSPNNVLVTPDGGLRLIDLEHAAVRSEITGTWSVLGIGNGTPGISAPEQFANADPDPQADLFSLGATLLHQITRLYPEFPADVPVVRSLETRVAERTEPPALPRPMAEAARAIVSGLMRTAPESRLSLDAVIELARPDDIADSITLEPKAPGLLSPQRLDDLVRGILGHLAATLAPRTSARPWPETDFGQQADPCAVQHGLAGSVAVLARLIACGVPGPLDRLVDATLPRIVGHLDRHRHRLPGLYFGFAGTAWALHDIGAALDRRDLTDRAVELVAELPTVWPNPDITHGLAGLGTCLLYLAAQTEDASLLRRAEVCADNVMAAADDGDEDLFWTIPTSFDSLLAGYRSYGFAHGVAGIGTFLLAVGHATGREDFVGAAGRCADTLLNAAIQRDDAAFWPDQPGSSLHNVWWCNGSSGIGTFLCRMYSRTGEARYREAAVAAARAVMTTRWQTGTAYCHGLSGNGDFLLDLALATGDEEFTDWASTLADLLWTRRCYRDGRAVLPDETGHAITGGFGAGSAGHLAFLTRLRFGGPRLFHPDPTVSI